MHLAHAEVGPRVDRAPVGDPPGRGEQPPGRPPVQPRGGGDLLGDRRHLLAGLEVALGVDPVEVAGVQRHQPAGRVEHVDGRGVGAVGVAHRVGEHRGEPLLDGQPEHPGGPGLVVGTAVRDHLEHQVGRLDHLLPAGQHRPGQVRPAGGEGPADLGPGTEQHQQAAAGRGRGPDVLGHQVQGAHRLPALAAQVGGRHQPAQRRPAGLVPGQQGDPRVPRVDGGAAPRRVGPAGRDWSAGWTIRGGESSPVGSRARSTPSTGRIPADRAARANFTAPYRPSRSVSARVSMPCSTARSTRTCGCEAPWRSE